MATKKELAALKAERDTARAKIKEEKEAEKARLKAEKEEAKAAKKAAKAGEVVAGAEAVKPPVVKTVVFEGATVLKVLNTKQTVSYFHCQMSDGTSKQVPKELFE